MRRRVLFAIELVLVSAVVILTRSANYRDVFVGGRVYFVDADCYARMSRARICSAHPGTIIRHHDFENYPSGTSPHTTALFDYLIVAIAGLLSPFAAPNASTSLDLAGAIVSPIIAVALGIFLCWWTRRIAMRFRFALIALYAVSPILAHGTALGRPDHQSLIIALIAVALCAEWMLWASPTRAWAIVSGASWAMAMWVSLYEPFILLAVVTAILLTGSAGVQPAALGIPAERNAQDARNRRWRGIGPRARTGWIAFAALIAVAAIVERRFPAWPTHQSIGLLRNWSGTISELAHVPLKSGIWFQWCSWLLVLAPILFWPKRSERSAPVFLIALLAVTFVLTIAQARWSYFFALVFTLLAPAILDFFRNRVIALSVFLIALFAMVKAWDGQLSEPEESARAETREEQIELRAIASRIDAPALAPWWFSPAVSYWSGQPCVAGSSHESISGIEDCAKFYATTDAKEAEAICVRREVQWVVGYDADRLAKNSAQILGAPVPGGAMCEVLDRTPSRAPGFLHLVAQTARFKLYHVGNNAGKLPDEQ